MSHLQQSKLKEVPLGFKPTLIISKEIQSQIMYLHNKVKDIEWCGILFYSIVSGTITDPDNLVLKAEKIFLGDIGVGTYTEMSTDETIIDFYDAYPAAMSTPWKQGYIHTHHSMATFFSGTDMQELHDNAGSHNYYLSLIVNHKSEFCAKVAIVAEAEIPETKSSYKFKGNDNAEQFEFKNAGSKSDILMLLDCSIEFEQNEFEKARYEHIKAEKAKVKVYTHHHYPNYGVGFQQPGKGMSKQQFKNQASAWDEGQQLEFFNNNAPHISANSSANVIKDNVILAKEVDEVTFRSFVAKWLALDITNENLVSDNLKVIANMSKQDLRKHVEELSNNLDGFVKDVLFITNYEQFEEIVIRLVGMLKGYGDYKNLDKVIHMLKIDHVIYESSLKK